MGTAERRGLILQAAERLFEHYGYGKTTMADVAREAGIGVGSVYLEFDSKEAIVQELSLSTHDEVLQAMRAAAAAARRLDAAGRLRAVLAARTARFVALRERGHHACELLHCKTVGVREAQRRFREDERALLAGLIAEGVTAGAFAPSRDGIPRTAALIQCAYASLSPPAIFALDEDCIALSASLGELLIQGLLARDANARASRSTPNARRRAR